MSEGKCEKWCKLINEPGFELCGHERCGECKIRAKPEPFWICCKCNHWTHLEAKPDEIMERDDLRREMERLKKVIKEKYDESAFLESELVEKDVEIAALKAEVQRLTAEEQAWRKFTTEADRTMDKADAEIAALKAKLEAK